MVEMLKKMWTKFIVGLVTVVLVIALIVFVAFMFWLDKLRFVW